MPNRFDKYKKPRAPEDTPATGPAIPLVRNEPMRGRPAHEDNRNIQPWVRDLGGGMARGAKGLANLVMNYGPGSSMGQNPMTEDAPIIGNKALAASDKEQEGKPFSWSRLAGEGLVTAPVPGGMTASGGRLFGAKAIPRALEGALSAMQYSNPEKRVKEGAQGALLSAVIGRGADAVGRFGRGLVKRSDAAEHLNHFAQQAGQQSNIPISLAADYDDPVSAMVGGTYKHASPLVPFMAARLEGQRKKSKGLMTDLMWAEAAPGNLKLTPAELKNPDLAAKRIRNEFTKLYDSTVKSYAFNVPTDLRQTMEGAIRAKRPNIDSTTLKSTVDNIMGTIERFSDGQPQITGDNLLFAKRKFTDMWGKSEKHEKDAYEAATEWLDKHIVDEMSQGNKASNLEDLKTYLQLGEPWKEFIAVQKAVKKAGGGELSGKALHSSSKPGTVGRSIGESATEVLDKRATAGGFEGKALAAAGTIGAVGGTFMAPKVLAAAMGIGHFAANPSTQRFLLGDTYLQRQGKKLVDDNPLLAQALAATRRGTVAQGAE